MLSTCAHVRVVYELEVTKILLIANGSKFAIFAKLKTREI